MRILIGFDGSPSASAALKTVLGFPWPACANARCVVALVVGARGTSGLRRVLLGSVAAGSLDRGRCPVVVAR